MTEHEKVRAAALEEAATRVVQPDAERFTPIRLGNAIRALSSLPSTHVVVERAVLRQVREGLRPNRSVDAATEALAALDLAEGGE